MWLFSLVFSLAAPPVEPAVAEVQAVLAGQVAAWNRGDLEAFCALYAEDAVFVSPKGVTRGRAQVLARYRQRYPDQAAMGTLALTVLEARGTPTMVSLAGRWQLTYADRPPAEGHTLIVFQRTAPGAPWQLVQDASM